MLIVSCCKSDELVNGVYLFLFACSSYVKLIHKNLRWVDTSGK